MKHVETFVSQCEPYNVPAIVQWPNEPGNYREGWPHGVPDDWFAIFMELWMSFAGIVTMRGAIAGFHDGP